MGRSLLGSFAMLALASSIFAAEPKPKMADPGVLPLGADGKPLNLDFETGTLKDWVAEGEAFKGQPIKGDVVSARRNDSKSQHQGDYWIGGYEKVGDKAQGTLSSVPFKVTHPWGSFLVGGGPHESTCVELVSKETGKVFFCASGLEEENLRRVAVDLKDLMGKEMFIRVVDKHVGHWGHVNFDDFRFHTEKPSAAPRPLPLVADAYTYAGLKPEDAAKAMTVPDGFEVKLFAGEPDIVQPIAFCIDDRGRLWVAEAYSYPTRRNDKDAKDRILIFEDTDGDGKFDKRTVFMEGLNLVSGLEVGFGGVWIGAAPYLMYVPMKDDKPSGPTQILLDSWGYQDTHETLNAFTWGPDGWLYGCHGVFTHSAVGKPGTTEKDRTKINAGVWRYHPTKHVFEVFAHGTSNPWGLDFDAHGNAFVTACVIPHAFHIIQGGRYQRQAGQHFNPYTYADIPTIADHLHWQGTNQWAGNASSGSKGGGHAHCGLMIYQGGSWPKEYHGRMFMGNIHGHRINTDILKPKGSGFTASHGPDFLMANDSWARFINLKYGPDGNVYLIDWYDKQACHHKDERIWDRSNGRIYKICHKDAKPVKVDLQKCTDKELVEYQLHENEWYVRHARRILQERAAEKNTDADSKKMLVEIARNNKDETMRLRAWWAISSYDPAINLLLDMVKDPSDKVASWVGRLAIDQNLDSFFWASPFHARARERSSQLLRCAIASTLLREPVEMRMKILSELLRNFDDGDDLVLSIMYWYVAESIAEKHPEYVKELVRSTRNLKLYPIVGRMVRRLAADGRPEALELAVHTLNDAEGAQEILSCLTAINDGLKGRRLVPMPKNWTGAYVQPFLTPEIRAQAAALAVTFGDSNAFASVRKILRDGDADLGSRQNALATLLGAKDKELAPVLQMLLSEPPMRSASLKGLAAYDDAKTPAAILEVYAKLNSEEKRDALNTLASRSIYAKELLAGVEGKKIAPSDVSADIVRSMMNLNDPAIEKQIGAVWGIARRTPAEKLKLIAETKKMVLAKPQAAVDLWHGRAMFQKTCAQCHMLYGIGAKIGPDITGSNRPNLDYLLENVLDPSAVIPKEYAMSIFELDNGRKVQGIVKEETPATVTVQTANEVLILSKKEIEMRRTSDVSMMPDDILKTLKPDEFRALIAYLQHPQQVPMLATEENAKDFFNGKDLTSWYGDPKLWSVEKGEIVGKSPGIKHNEFLKSHLAAGDFKLTLQVKLTPDKENSGVQFRSEPLPNGEMKGHQADIGAGWWGKLYEESGRGLIWDKPGDIHVKKDDWNEYVILVKGSKIQTWINGKLCVDVDDPKGAKRGIFALQIHSGGAMEVRFKDLKLEVNPK